jgi:hypothetical protein
MDKEQYIRSKFRSIISETIDGKIKDITEKLNLGKETKLYKDNEFDYVQEKKGDICEQCGGEVTESKICEQCGSKAGEVMEDDKKLSKISDEEIEDLLKDLKSDSKNKEIKEKLYGKQRNIDKNKNGKIDSKDFEMLRKHDSEIDENFLKRIMGRKEEDTPIETPKSEKNQVGFRYDPSDFDPHTMMHRSDMEAMDNEFRKRKESPQPAENQPREKRSTMSPEAEKMDKDWGGLASVMGVDPREAQRLSDMMKDETNEEQLYEVEFEKEIEEGETEEGNAFTGALAKAKKEGDDDFEVDGKKFNVKESILYTESDLVDLIERLVKEEKSKFTMKEPKGYREYERAHRADKKENDDYLKSVAKKMTDYLKGSSDDGSKYEMKETKKFPTENGGLKKGIRKKYTPSDAVDEYIDAFSYPGQTNLRFDEVKPNKKNIEKYLKGHSTTGNAQVDEDGNALGNVVPSEVGEKFYKNFEENLYGQEQADASYKRQSQPVDVAGDDTEEGSLKSKRGKKSKKTADSVLDKLDESVNDKKTQMLNEEFEKIQKLMNYSKRTQ